ncbi:M1 family metallopeptidase [Psychroflexus planctonicus]|uniref:Aminopeptidase N n=1 Tax=Psychroflexus planctonicus TaxID=1526575 RepID=A0ABQ1SD21_9FLAO|nr:M1 family metallopeptidase [Psychroflexus planctonicus]GGE23402.1 aminopeptidase [Psychroflexus planctonicus]
MKFFYILFLLFSFQFSLFAQSTQLKVVDFQTANVSIELLPTAKKVKGKIDYSFQMLNETDSIFLDAKNMKADLEEASFRNATLETTSKHFILKGKFKKNKSYTLSLSFEAEPQQTMYFLGFDFEKENHQIWTQGQGKYTSHWLPSIDDMNDKITFNLAVEAPEYLTVVANGKQVEVEENDSTSVWKFQMQKPMSSYLLALAAGNYDFQTEIFSTEIPLYNYYETADSLLVEPTYRYTQFIFDFFEEEIGVPYPWQNYKQVPVRDFLHSGMENTGLTVFSNQFMVDSIGFEDFNYVNVNAHEMAHQWFGNLVTETEAKHHWLHEGFATYYALLAEREVFGDDHFYNQLYISAEQLKELSDQGKGQAILNPKASSLTFYQKGAWAVHILRERVGEVAFKEAVKNYLEKYAFQNVTTDDFLDEIAAVSEIDVSQFKKDWLLQTAFQAEDALASLKKSLFMQELLGVISLREQSVNDKIEIFQRIYNQSPSPFVVKEMALQLSAEMENPNAESLIKQLLASDYLRAQLRIVAEVSPIPQAFQNEFEALLKSQNSYLLTENLLFNLWVSFPDERATYLAITKNIEGFKDKNVLLLWKFLSMVTPDHEPENAMKYFRELNGFTSPKYNFKVRENSFNYLYQVDRFADQTYLNLIDACFHHQWNFKSFARKMLEKLLQEEQHQVRILDLEQFLNEAELKLIRQYLSE